MGAEHFKKGFPNSFRENVCNLNRYRYLYRYNLVAVIAIINYNTVEFAYYDDVTTYRVKLSTAMYLVGIIIYNI